MLSDRLGREGGELGEGGFTRSFLMYGFLLWLVATVAFRLFGQFVLVPGGGLLLFVVFVLTVPGIAALMYPLYASRGLGGRDRLLAAVCVMLPGMVLDVFALAFFGVVYPNLGSATAPYFGAFLLWAYALVLVTGLFPTRTSR